MIEKQFHVGLSAAVLAAFTFIGWAAAHEPIADHACPEDYPDEPAIARHIEQHDVAAGVYRYRELIEHGENLFVGVFNLCDGQGRPLTTGTGNERPAHEPQPAFIRTSAPDSNACAGCHAQPRAGGAGDFVANVFVLAQARHPVTDSVSAEFSNERNTLGMFGSGAIELLSREITVELLAIQDVALVQAATTGLPVTASLDSKGVNYGTITAYPGGSVDTAGVRGVDADLVIKPFHQAGVVISLREFTVNALNHHHGIQAEERFDLQVGTSDFDGDGIGREATIGDVTAMVLFQASLAVPGRVLPADPAARAKIDRGEALFEAAVFEGGVDCASCHVPEMMLNDAVFSEPNPFNPTGTFADTGLAYTIDLTRQGERPMLERTSGGGAVVRAYTDLKRHDLCDDEIDYFCNEQLAQGRPDQEGKEGARFFLTRKLWDVGNSAPYGHRGDLTTITDAIYAHGGEARASRDAFVAMPAEDQRAVVAFLKTLRVLPAGSPRVVIEGQDGRVADASDTKVVGANN